MNTPQPFLGPPHGRDHEANLFIGRIASEVAMLAHAHNRPIEVVVGAFINEYARGAWEASRKRALEPSLN